MLSTVAKHVTQLYKNSTLSGDVKRCCKEVREAIQELQSFIVKLGRIRVVNEALGTSLATPVITRWSSTYKMVLNYMSSEEQILGVLNEQSVELANEHTDLMNRCRGMFKAYLQIVEPIADYITLLEVRF